jgi:VCBS repeat-containing protein
LGGLSDEAAITINLTNVNEAPRVSDVTFSLPENSVDGTDVGRASATDPDAGDTLTFSVLSGNTLDAFTIDPNTGTISVAERAALDFETHATFTLRVRATDAAGARDDGTITIQLTNVNEAPTVANTTFSLPENSAAGRIVGNAIATDPLCTAFR